MTDEAIKIELTENNRISKIMSKNLDSLYSRAKSLEEEMLNRKL